MGGFGPGEKLPAAAHGSDEERACAICFNVYTTESPASVTHEVFTPCNHSFCLGCLETICRYEPQPCPVCRRPFSLSSLRGVSSPEGVGSQHRTDCADMRAS